MDMTTQEAVNDFMGRARGVSFEMMRRKLMHPEHGEGWSEDRVNFVEQEYLRFLLLNRFFDGEDIVPSKEVDTFWHYHILDTKSYTQDVSTLLGRMLHHYPYFGMDEQSDDADLAAAFRRTQELYEEVFHEPMLGYEASCLGQGSSCAGRCKG